MLTHINISNYTIASALEMEFAGGMTVITGETGAGKSIMLDALGLCLGNRADPKAVRHGCDRAEINAAFDIANIPQAQQWLADRDLNDPDQPDECLLRRVVTSEGRSRAYINGSVATLQDCTELGGFLIDIHGQHAHQSLLRRPVQRALLDAYADHLPLTRSVEQTASEWLRSKRELDLLAGSSEERSARAQLLAYQVDELDELALEDGELATLEQEQKLLANAESILADAHQALSLCEEQESGVKQALQLLSSDNHSTAGAGAARELLDSAAIAITEARGEVQAHIDSVDVDPERLGEVQRRLETVYDVARKHRVLPEQLAERHNTLREELQALADGGERIAELEASMATLASRYEKDAKTLGKQRKAAARKLVKATAKILDTLAMEQCEMEISLNPVTGSDPHPHGNEDIEFLISTNRGAAKQPLGKIASGGELSRISLAIAVVTASAGTVPSMVFDEVDVGIGGAVAEVVGKLLQAMADSAQVLCVTHLPQVAAQGHHHIQVTKSSTDDSVETRVEQLKADAKVEEIARMLGGVTITKQTLAHAREMLKS